MLSAFFRYGPDRAEVKSRDPSFEDIARRSAREWNGEMKLLPHRYKRNILPSLCREGLISEEMKTKYEAEARGAIFGGEVYRNDGSNWTVRLVNNTFPWVEHPEILERASGVLVQKIREFEADREAVFKHTKGVLEAISLPSSLTDHK